MTSLQRAAQRILKAGDGHWAHQADEIVIREADGNEENPRLVFIIPLGNVIGFAVVRGTERPKDEDIAFVSAHAVASALPAMGFMAAPGSFVGPAALPITPTEENIALGAIRDWREAVSK